MICRVAIIRSSRWTASIRQPRPQEHERYAIQHTGRVKKSPTPVYRGRCTASAATVPCLWPSVAGASQVSLPPESKRATTFLNPWIPIASAHLRHLHRASVSRTAHRRPVARWDRAVSRMRRHHAAPDKHPCRESYEALTLRDACRRGLGDLRRDHLPGGHALTTAA
jgi:hypothetical protein